MHIEVVFWVNSIKWLPPFACTLIHPTNMSQESHLTLSWLECHSLVIWFQFYGFMLNPAQLNIWEFTSGFKETCLWVFVARLVAWSPGTFTIMTFCCCFYWQSLTFMEKLSFVSQFESRVLLFAHLKSCHGLSFQRMKRPKFSTSVNDKWFYCVLWTFDFVCCLVWDIWLPLG